MFRIRPFQYVVGRGRSVDGHIACTCMSVHSTRARNCTEESQVKLRRKSRSCSDVPNFAHLIVGSCPKKVFQISLAPSTYARTKVVEADVEVWLAKGPTVSISRNTRARTSAPQGPRPAHQSLASASGGNQTRCPHRMGRSSWKADIVREVA